MYFFLFFSVFCFFVVVLIVEVKKFVVVVVFGIVEKLSFKVVMFVECSVGLVFSLYQVMVKDQVVENILVLFVVVVLLLGFVFLGGKVIMVLQVKVVLSVEQLCDEEVYIGLGELLCLFSNFMVCNVIWKLGSCLYGFSFVSFVDDFVCSSKQYYNCEYFKINFCDKCSVLQFINEWVVQIIDGKLFEVIKDVECMDGVLLVNVMFFKLYWDEKFYYKMVDNCGFMVIWFYIVGVMMMYWIGFYNYYDDEKEKL